MGEAESVARNRELQRRWYGEPLGDRLRRLLIAYAIPQVVLADTLGLSSSMLSQLMSGRRGKIGAPVLGRVVLLERQVDASGRGDPATLAAVRAAESTVAAGACPEPVAAYTALRTAAAPDELARAAETLDGSFPSLAVVLRRAAEAS